MSPSNFTMIRLRSWIARLHRDESAPNTIEWSLLGVVSLIIILAVLLFVASLDDTHKKKSENAANDPFMQSISPSGGSSGAGNGNGNGGGNGTSDDASATPIPSPEPVSPGGSTTPNVPPPVSGSGDPFQALMGQYQPASQDSLSDTASGFAGYWWGSDHSVYYWDPDDGWIIAGTY